MADITSFPSMRQVDAGALSVGYAEAGPASGPAVLLLHGWPYDIHSYGDAASLLAAAGFRVIVPHLRGFGSTRFLDDHAPRNGQQSVFAFDSIALMDALGIDRALVAGFDWGARTASILAALWPERVRGHVSVSGYLIGSREANEHPLPPAAELAWWYQFYFATERGRAGYAQYRSEFARLIWQTASPQWRFDDATFDRSAASFENPDHVDIVIHNYRWRLGLADGAPENDELERRLAQRPPIAVPTITLEGDTNGAPHPDPPSYRAQFVGPYEHRLITGGVGHNLPQEAPQAFADAVIDLHRSIERSLPALEG
jgi:pimeloyl-ACP methyl ester carboxylesterase